MGKQVLAGAVLDLHERAAFDPEDTLPETTLAPNAERNIEAAANLLSAGADPKKVLRTLYCLASLDALTAKARS